MDSALQTTSTAIGVCGETAAILNTMCDATVEVQPTVFSLEPVMQLLRRAMSALEHDRAAAWRCLKDASALLGSETQDPVSGFPLPQNAFRPGGLARWQAKKALAYIDANIGSKLEICELAALVAFSKSHFSRAFKRSLGLPPMAYVAARRVERAKAMMTSTREQLTEIALACGFADQSHLNRSFRRSVGMSPGAWRRARADVTRAE